MTTRPPKQAVLLIHGIGFQRPMRTLRGFVEQVWTQQPALRRKGDSGQAWSKPDTISKSFELRRLTTVANIKKVRTDFFEFYWAHLMRGTTIQEIGIWLRTLLFRLPWHVPAPLALPYYLLWILLPVFILVQINAALPASGRWWSIAPVAGAVVSVVLLPGILWLLREFVGDAAVYLDDSPNNIQRRHAIRSAGVELLKALHDRGYVRIIVVGHSLGSVIGYDILKYAWAEVYAKVDPAKYKSTAALENLGNMLQPGGVADREFYVAAQRAYLAELQAAGHPWRVTDFVTLGSPLTYAELLLGRDRDDFQRKIYDRELPCCPPVTEPVEGLAGRYIWFKQELPTGGYVPTPHHAALFAATVWTNLYFKSDWFLHGDVIGGPIAARLGWGIGDKPVATARWGGYLSHTHYWSAVLGEDTHLAELSRALDLAI